MNPWNNAAFLQRVEHRKGYFRAGDPPVSELPPAVAAIWDRARGLATFAGPGADCVVVSLPWDCEEAADLHAAGFTPELATDGMHIGEQDWCWRRNAQPLAPRAFDLVRDHDATGISGTGRVAEGVLFGDGRCVLRWCTATRSMAIYDTLADLIRIHGHNGATRVCFKADAGASE